MYYNIKNILWENGFKDKSAYQNIYIEIYKALKKAILNGDLPVNTKLPPTRLFATDLNVSRSTVLKAYELLVTEKYISSRKGSGHFIMYNQSDNEPSNYMNQGRFGGYPSLSKLGLSFRNNFQILSSDSDKGIAFRPGLAPLDIFPVRQWNNLSNNYWKQIKPSELSYSPSTGLKSLRESIAGYLKIYRNIDVLADQIIITSGSLHSLFLVSSALIDPNNDVVLENPTHPHALQLFKSLGAKINAARIDDEGMNLDSINCNHPKLIYTTPSNQYPTGTKMTMNRRIEILQWASQKKALIIEDDYDHEFSNWDNPVSSMYGMDNHDRVVYLGTFNKLLHPSLRIGYMILPNYLGAAVSSIYEQSSRFVSPAIQTVLSMFIDKDHINKHLRNVIDIAKERKAVFVKSFNAHFENDIWLNTKNNGLHIIGELEPHIKDSLFSAYLKSKGVITHPLSRYYIEGPRKNGLMMGYSSVNNKLIKETISKMNTIYTSYKLDATSF